MLTLYGITMELGDAIYDFRVLLGTESLVVDLMM